MQFWFQKPDACKVDAATGALHAAAAKSAKLLIFLDYSGKRGRKSAILGVCRGFPAQKNCLTI
jgi:hypothetical protein